MDEPFTKVLLVDDDEDDFILTQDMFADIGHGRFQLDWASTFDGALEHIDRNEHDVYLVDYFMGDHNGLELLQYAAEQGCTAPIILLTGVGGYEVDVEAMKSGAADFLVKDQMTPHVLERSIRYALERKRAQDALEASEEQYRVIFEASADALLIFDMAGVILEVNPAAGAIYGYSRSEMIGLSAKDIIHPDYYHEFEEFMRRVKVAGEYHGESVDIARGGIEFNVEVRGSLFHYKGHDRLLTIVRDTTDRKHAESVLRESEEKYRSVVDNIGTGVALISPAMKVLALNKQMRRWFPDASASGWHICHEVFNDPPRESVCPGCPVALTLQDGEVHEAVIETSVSNKVVHYRMISSPVLNAEGKILGAIEMAEDITERRRAEEAQARLATAVEQAHEAIVITAVDGTIEYANPSFERTTGYSADEAIGRNLDALNAGENSRELSRQIWATLEGGGVWAGHIANRKKDGSPYEEEVTISPVRDDTGNIINYVAVKRDVTQQMALEMKLRQVQKLESIGQLAAGIAHEINTPTQYVCDNTRFLQRAFADLLALIQRYRAMLEAAKRGEVDPETIAEVQQACDDLDLDYLIEEIPAAIEESLGGIDRVIEIVRAMKEFSHPSVKEKKPVNINKEIQTTITVARNEWKYVAEMQTDLDESLPLVPCLPGEFNQMILNIIVNAAQAISDKIGDTIGGRGTIAVATKQDHNWAEIRISDTGAGMPDEVKARAFDPFFTTKEVGKGTGQGLAIARSVVVDMHGGTIAFDTQVGVGTTFIIRLPIDPQPTDARKG